MHTSDLEYEIGAYGGEEVTPRKHRPARYLRNTEQAVIAEQLANQQRIDEARARQQQALANARQNRTTRSPTLGRQRPYAQTSRAYREDEQDIDGNGDVWPAQVTRSAIRYAPGYDVSEEEVYQQGNKRLHLQYVDVPPRASAKPRLPPAPQQHTAYPDDIDEPETERPRPRRGHTRRVHFHPLVWLGVGMIVMFFLWVGISYASSWVQTTLDDWHYGRPRTYQVDAVVGHGDSPGNPSHFVAINLNRHIVIIELPGGDSSRARIYTITTVFGDGQELTPITLTFQDVNGDKLPDMIIHIGDQKVVFINEKGGFRPLRSGEHIHM